MTNSELFALMARAYGTHLAARADGGLHVSYGANPCRVADGRGVSPGPMQACIYLSKSTFCLCEVSKASDSAACVSSDDTTISRAVRKRDRCSRQGRHQRRPLAHARQCGPRW